LRDESDFLNVSGFAVATITECGLFLKMAQSEVWDEILRRLRLCSLVDNWAQAVSWIPNPLFGDMLRVVVANTPKNNGEIVSFCAMVARGLARLPEQERISYLWPILERLESLQDVFEMRPGALAALTPHLPKQCLDRALNIALTITDDSSRAGLLVTLAARFPLAERTECLT
jgi:hypothetical protein